MVFTVHLLRKWNIKYFKKIFTQETLQIFFKHIKPLKPYISSIL